MSKRAQILLDKLILDYCSHLPSSEKVYRNKDSWAYIYNLFNGNYEYSANDVKELFEYFKNNPQ